MISIDREMLWQWDRGQRVQLHDVPVGTKVHFSNAAIKPNALVKEAYEDGEGVYANIPDILLQTAGTLTAYIYIEDGDEGHTEYRKLFIVRDREKPDDYVYTEDDIKTWVSLEERIKVLEESGGGAAGGLIRPLSTIGEIDGVTVKHVPDKDRVELTVEMTADSMNSVFGGNAVYKNDFLNARQLQLMFRIPGAGRLFLWELFEDDLITVTNYPNKKFIMVSTNRMIVSFTYDENGQFVSETKTYQANVQQLDDAKATIPNRATVNSTHALVMQRADGDNVTDLFGAYIPFAFESYRYFSDVDWGTTLGSSFVVRDPYVSKGEVYPDIPDGCEAPFICHTTLVRYTLTVVVCTADGRYFKTYLNLTDMTFSSVTEIGTADIPKTLPNPHPLTFTGAVEATYDGSKPVSVEIPMGGSKWNLISSETLTEDTAVIEYGNLNCREVALYFTGRFNDETDSLGNATAAVHVRANGNATGDGIGKFDFGYIRKSGVEFTAKLELKANGCYVTGEVCLYSDRSSSMNMRHGGGAVAGDIINSFRLNTTITGGTHLFKAGGKVEVYGR